MMGRMKSLVSLLLIVSIVMTGCGSINSEDKSKTDAQKLIEQEKAKNNEENKTEPEIHTTEITKDEKYNDGEHIVSFVGLKEYKKLKTDKYLDKPKKGKKYLVLFLECSNYAEELLYINTDNFISKIDGKEVEHTVVFNEPEGYPTLFRNYESGQKDFGFVVWEVSKDWKTLDITYTGLEYTNQNRFVMNLTKKDLKNPKQYSRMVPK